MSIRLENKGTGFFGRVDLPYKVTKYHPESETYYVLGSQVVTLLKHTTIVKGPTSFKRMEQVKKYNGW
jgi:hypothetical protein